MFFEHFYIYRGRHQNFSKSDEHFPENHVIDNFSRNIMVGGGESCSEMWYSKGGGIGRKNTKLIKNYLIVV